jgi:hypothetical protein
MYILCIKLCCISTENYTNILFHRTQRGCHKKENYVTFSCSNSICNTFYIVAGFSMLCFRYEWNKFARQICFHSLIYCINPLNTELNPICHLLALLGGVTIVVVSRLRVNKEAFNKKIKILHNKTQQIQNVS